ncbi:MAG: FAD-dependent oxidoreductase, partial [Pseudomonadales bacterium]|nr:FAD-dependent oxidoreductase [Pseudomonadales bacterium]
MAVTVTDINYTFSDDELEKLKHFGDIRHHNKGEVLIPEGSNQVDCLITLTGQVDIHVATTDGSIRVGWMEPGQFAGDITVLTGHTYLAETTMGETGDVLHISHESFKRLLAENVDFSDIFVRTLTARRAFARESDFGTIIVIGGAQDRTVFAARDLLAKHGLPHTWLDPETDELADKVLAARDIPREQLPVVLRGNSRVLSKPTVSELSEAFGLDLLPDGSSADVVIVGAGPAGLAASVYAASEGLSVVTVDADGPGGQAGTSSKIENYLGFPQGLSGRELSERASVQAQKFGVRLATPARAKSVYQLPNDYYCLELEDGRKLSSKAIVIATGAQYRRLPLANLERFE